MIIGIYIFVVCVIVGRRIKQTWFEGLEHIDDDSCVESRLLMPEWLFDYLVYMIRGGKEKRLACYLVFMFVAYCAFVTVVSWLFGLSAFHDMEPVGKMYGYGLLLYVVSELAAAGCFSIYYCSKSMVESVKQMKDFRTRMTRKIAEEADDETPRDQTVVMAKYLTENPDTQFHI